MIKKILKNIKHKIVLFFKDQAPTEKDERLFGFALLLIVLLIIIHNLYLFISLGDFKVLRKIPLIPTVASGACEKIGTDFKRCTSAQLAGEGCAYFKCGCATVGKDEATTCKQLEYKKTKRPSVLDNLISFLENITQTKKLRPENNISVVQPAINNDINCYKFSTDFKSCTSAQNNGSGCVWFGCGCGLALDGQAKACKFYQDKKSP